jgi:hypothetical protein
MVGHGAKFDQKKDHAIAALLSHRTVEEAARTAGIGTNTLQRWMKEPEFEAAFEEARRSVLSQALGRLKDASGAAATTMLKIMLDPNVPAGTRLRAAEVVLEQAARASQSEDIEHRVAELERNAGLKKAHKRSAEVTLVSDTRLLGPAPTQAKVTPQPADAETAENIGE